MKETHIFTLEVEGDTDALAVFRSKLASFAEGDKSVKLEYLTVRELGSNEEDLEWEEILNKESW